jgi:hypothetical protein
MDQLPLSYRRLRRALIAVSMLCALLVLVVIVVFAYWDRYLLGPSSGPFERGPFLTSVSTNSATLAWTARGGAPVELRAVSATGSPAVARGGRFTGLRPGTVYAWTAAVDRKTRASGTFTTAPRTLEQPIEFGAIGDYGSGNDHEYAVGRVLAAGRPAFVVTAGDNSYLAAIPQFLDRNIFKPLAAVMANAPLWATFGEHDVFWRNGTAVTDALHLPGKGGRYTVRYGPVQLVLLGLTAADRSAYDYAKRELSRPGPAVRFVVVHRPLKPGNPIIRLFRERHVAAVIAGHLHRYERRLIGGNLMFTVGTGGQGPGDERFTLATPGSFSLLDYGALRVRVDPEGVMYTFVDERGRVLDHYHGKLTGP